ncbi:MAG: ABC transporter substrate-binding protein [Ectothiorhodospiraceae bacterium]|nr:ABC transporter substrate-binding protein [Chromatiales bacterium]MCP5157648.1 ABC transporter substrate-binding protein [Ectothiorhodospiraceae bacterium]
MLPGGALAQDSVTFSSWGGSFQDAQREALMKPAAATLGITIKEDTTNGIADVRAQVTANAVKWDIAEQGSNSCVLLTKEGHVEPLDYNVIQTDGIDKGVIGSHHIGIIYFSTVIAWNKEKYGDNGPQNWKDFWDTEKFPGTRSVYAKPYYNLEAALMADGVPKDKVYEVLSSDEGIDRAFKKLRELKPHIAVYWKSGAQSAQLLKDGEVDMIALWNGRAFTAIKDGANAAFTFNEGIFDFDCLVVPKGAPNKDLAMKVINEFLKAENQAQLPKYISYGPVNAKAFDLGVLTAEEMARVNSSPQNAAKQLVLDGQWYVPRYDKLQERFDAMIQE